MQNLEIKSFENQIESIRFCYLQAQFLEVQTKSLAILENLPLVELFIKLSPSSLLTLMRLFSQSLIELEQIANYKSIIEQLIIKLESEALNKNLLAQLFFFKSFWYLNNQNSQMGEKFLIESFQIATEISDFNTLSRCFHLQAVIFLNIQNTPSQALISIDKAITLAENLKNEELIISCSLLKSSILVSLNDLILAKDLLLECYQKSYECGQHRLIAQILIRLYSVYKDLQDEQSAFLIGTLALKSLNKENHTRLYKFAHKTIQINIQKTKLPDIKINQLHLKVSEKVKGVVEFNNQHILFELLLLLATHQGVRFSKEQLALKVWNQEYKPHQHDNLIYVSIKRLRSLIEPNVDNPIYILRDRSGYFIPTQYNIEISKENTLSNQATGDKKNELSKT